MAAKASFPTVARGLSDEPAYILSRIDAVSPEARNCCTSFTAMAERSPCRKEPGVIELHDVTQHYGVRPVLRGISLRVERGEVVVVEGNYGVRIQQIISRSDRLRSVR